MLNPRLDGTFKAIFTQDTDDSRNALRSFLSAMIDRTVTEVTVRENEPAENFEDQKGIRYDINCMFDDGTRAQVEMQGFDRKYNYGKRAEYYVSRLVSSIAVKGDDWDTLPKAYQITVMNFSYDETNEEPLHRYTLTDINDGSKLSDTINVIFLELPKLPPVDDKTDIKTLPTAIKWGKFLQEADNPKKKSIIDRIAKSEEGIMKAEVMLNALSDERWNWIIQGKIEGQERDIRSGLANAEERGRKEGISIGEKLGLQAGMDAKAISNARNLLAMGLGTHKQIAQAVELPIEKIEELAREMETANMPTTPATE
jgi:predicted transposase/invertase (TIGR01784 family)